MKAYALLAALALVAPAESFARDHHHSVVVVRGGSCGPRYSVSFGGGYYRPSYRPYGYGYAGYGYGLGYYGPALSLSYTSVPRTYYRSAPDYDDSESSLESDVQRELRRRGYYRGSVDGDIGPESRAAIRDYQADHGFAATGRIDSRLLRSLGL